MTTRQFERYIFGPILVIGYLATLAIAAAACIK
jgi:hypothetical protein